MSHELSSGKRKKICQEPAYRGVKELPRQCPLTSPNFRKLQSQVFLALIMLNFIFDVFCRFSKISFMENEKESREIRQLSITRKLDTVFA